MDHLQANNQFVSEVLAKMSSQLQDNSTHLASVEHKLNSLFSGKAQMSINITVPSSPVEVLLSTQNIPAIYTLNRSVSTVRDLCTEWYCGLQGHPSISAMDAKHGASWRSAANESKFYSRRKQTISVLEKLIAAENVDRDAGIKRIEALRGTKSIDWLS